jgi:hypothetical protein
MLGLKKSQTEIGAEKDLRVLKGEGMKVDDNNLSKKISPFGQAFSGFFKSK